MLLKPRHKLDFRQRLVGGWSGGWSWSGDTILNYALDVGSLWRYGFDMPRLARVVVPGAPHHN